MRKLMWPITVHILQNRRLPLFLAHRTRVDNYTGLCIKDTIGQQWIITQACV